MALRCPLEMGFRGPDGIGDKYHFVSNVAKRSGLIHARRPRQLSISNNTRTVEAVARLASSSICGVHREIGNRHEARAQTRVEHQERHGLQADKGAQDSDLSRRQIAISSEAFSSRSGGIDGRRYENRLQMRWPLADSSAP